MAYKINLRAIDELIQLPPGSSILIDGPAMIGKGVFARNIIFRGIRSAQATIVITAKDTTNDIQRWYQMHGFDLDLHSERYAIIDCLSYSLHKPDERSDDSKNIKYLDGTGNLTKIMYHTENMIQDFKANGITEIIIVLDSLSVFLMYLNLQSLFTFLHVLTGKVRESDGVFVALIDSDMHDSRTLSTVKQLFNGAVEMRYRGDDTVIRALGLSPSPTPWFRFVKGQPGQNQPSGFTQSPAEKAPPKQEAPTAPSPPNEEKPDPRGGLLSRNGSEPEKEEEQNGEGRILEKKREMPDIFK